MIDTDVIFKMKDKNDISKFVKTYDNIVYNAMFKTNIMLRKEVEWYIALGEESDD